MKNFLTNKCFITAAFLLMTNVLPAQNNYKYSVDLTKVDNDQLTVKLVTPVIGQNEIHFYLPKIVPGTYMNSNYGKYVHDLQAFDKSGKPLPVSKYGDNGWTIRNANKLYSLVYKVEDTWDSDIKNRVYSMCGTNIEAGKNFVLNTPGVFGYFEGMKKNKFQLSFLKPTGFYAATGLKPVTSNASIDVFNCDNADHLYDSPIMYSLPDTASVKVGNSDVLVAVYSPRKMATAKFIASNLRRLLLGAKDYLGGKLPVDKYAFIFYFNGEQKKMEESGAWEHAYSSFYSLDEEPEKESIAHWVDISAHEFFHIVTPLTISSREVKEFNFNETNLSKHLWLYEGSTEYYSQNMQAWAGIKTPEAFLESLSQKINYSRSYMNDSLSFTKMSKGAADKYADQYGNVYMKGALISACVDLQLLKLSNAQYGLRQLKHDLGIKYGKDRYFEDDSLFNEIAALSYPEIRAFFNDYVEGGTPIPYEKYFAMAGVSYVPKETYKDFSLGGLQLKPNDEGNVKIGIKDMNDFGRKLGYQESDEMISINDSMVNNNNIDRRIKELFSHAMEGDILTVKVKRKNAAAELEMKILSAPIAKVDKQRLHVLRFMENPTAEQLRIRNAWLNNHTATFKTEAVAADVNSLDGITKALYDVISGPAGPRDWNRFRSLFHPEAYMGAVTEKGEFRKFSPAQYIQGNAPFFMQHAFYEKEIGRKVNEFGNIAQVFTAYEYEAALTPPEHKKGINSVELIKENGRWYIMSISWDEERTGQQIPAIYLKQ
ncbi:MAG: peptidase M61 [Ferruginibacter sp.]